MKAIFKVDKECKHSRRYNTEDPKFPIKTVYVDREFSNGESTIEIQANLLTKEGDS
jgi:hypothetical protein